MTSLRIWRLMIGWGLPLSLEARITALRTYGEMLWVETDTPWGWRIWRVRNVYIGIARRLAATDGSGTR